MYVATRYYIFKITTLALKQAKASNLSPPASKNKTKQFNGGLSQFLDGRRFDFPWTACNISPELPVKHATRGSFKKLQYDRLALSCQILRREFAFSCGSAGVAVVLDPVLMNSFLQFFGLPITCCIVL